MPLDFAAFKDDLPPGLFPLGVEDYGRFHCAKCVENQICWIYYFPFLLSYSWSNHLLLLEEYGGSLCIYRLRRTENGAVLSLFLAPMPYNEEALLHALATVKTFNNNDATSFFVDAVNYRQVKELDFLAVDKSDYDYLYDPKEYHRLQGSKFASLRRKLRKCEELHLSITSFSPEHTTEAQQLLTAWRDHKRAGGQPTHGYKYSRYFLRKWTEFPPGSLAGKALFDGAKLVAFSLGGPLNSSSGAIFLSYADFNYPSLGHYLLYQQLLGMENFSSVNHGGDRGLPGLKIMKSSFHPIYTPTEYRARQIGPLPGGFSSTTAKKRRMVANSIVSTRKTEGPKGQSQGSGDGDHLLLDLRSITPDDHRWIADLVRTHGYKGSNYFFPNIVCYSNRRRQLLYRFTGQTLSIFRLRLRRPRRLDLFIPPLPFNAEALQEDLCRIEKFNGEQGCKVFHIDQQDIAPLQTLPGFSLTKDYPDYLYDPLLVSGLHGKQFESVRKSLNRLSRIYGESLRVRPYVAGDFGRCQELTDDWHRVRTSGVTRNTYDETIACLRLAAEFPEIVTGEVVTINDRIEAFTLGGPLNETVCCIYLAKSNLKIRDLGYLQRYQFIKNHQNYQFINDGCDGNIEGLRTLKHFFRPCQFHSVAKGVFTTANILSRTHRLRYPRHDAVEPMWVENPPALWNREEIDAALGKGQWFIKPGKDWVATGVTYQKTHMRVGDLVFTTDPVHWRKKYLDTSLDVRWFFKKGAAAVVTSNPQAAARAVGPVFLVDNTYEALIRLGTYARNRFRGRVICITGSVGKTTTKEMARSLLAHAAPTVGSRENFNQLSGLAMGMAHTHPDIRYGVYEFSADTPWKTLPKARMMRPHIAVITAIEADHLTLYKDLEGVARQKSLLLDGMEKDGTLILNRDSQFYRYFSEKAQALGIASIISFGRHPEATIQLLSVTSTVLGSRVAARVANEEYRYSLPHLGQHMALNSLAALAIVKAAGEDVATAAGHLGQVPQVEHRLQVEKLPRGSGFFYLVDDSYNANPSSMRSAIDTVAEMRGGTDARIITVLGEMWGLEDQSESLHIQLAHHLMQHKVDHVICFGEEMAALYAALPASMRGGYGNFYLEVMDAIEKTIQPGDIVLVKGSGHIDEIGEILLPRIRNLTVHGLEDFPSPPVIARRVDLGSQQFSLLLGGDFAFGENYQEHFAGKGAENLLLTRGYTYPLRNLLPLLRRTDLVVANMKAPLTKNRHSPFAQYKTWIHRSDPVLAPKAMQECGIGLVNLANTTILDCGWTPFQQTVNILHEHGIQCFGGGRNLQTASEPYVLLMSTDNASLQVAIHGLLPYDKVCNFRYKAYASDLRCGVNPLSLQQLKKQLDRFQGTGTLQIAYLEWGKGYTPVSENQRKIAHSLIDAGFHLVFGTGSHSLQPVERYRSGLIFYDLGNFMVNSPGRFDKEQVPPYGLLAKLIFTGQGSGITASIRLYPIYTNNRRTGYQNRFLERDELEGVVTLLAAEGLGEDALLINAEPLAEGEILALDLDVTLAVDSQPLSFE